MTGAATDGRVSAGDWNGREVGIQQETAFAVYEQAGEFRTLEARAVRPILRLTAPAEPFQHAADVAGVPGAAEKSPVGQPEDFDRRQIVGAVAEAGITGQRLAIPADSSNGATLPPTAGTPPAAASTRT